MAMSKQSASNVKPPTTRTRGDGMDSSLLKLNPSGILLQPFNNQVIKPSKRVLATFQPVKPNGRVHKLVPKYVPKEQKLNKFFAKVKDPKFVPYEPFKAAVDPIIPHKLTVVENHNIGPKHTKNNVDIQDLVTQMSEMATIEMNNIKSSDEEVISKKMWEEEKNNYENDIKNLRESNTHLENQLKFQAQVNAELKTLLVAAVGEDLESRVQHLTEDKLQLARALLNSANHLTSHQEQTEWLSGQCEVWRSKFLASSLMVEELARWKSALTNKVAECEEIIKGFLEERSKSRIESISTYYSLNAIIDYCNSHKPPEERKKVALNSSDLFHLVTANRQMSSMIESDMLKNCPKDSKKAENDITDLPMYTRVENSALQALRNPVSLPSRPDVLCNAVVGAAGAVSSGQMYLQHPSIHATCCSHCKGEVVNV